MAAPARVEVEGDTVRITLRGMWPLLALRRTVEVPRSGVIGAEVVDDARPLLRGMRVGTYVPGGAIAGRFFAGADTDFWAVRGTGRVLVLTMAGGPFSRIVVETADPDQLARDLGGRPSAGVTATSRPARRISRGARWSGVVAILAGGTVLVGVAALAADAVPSPMATHWSIGGGPNGQMTIIPMTLIVLVVYAATSAPAVAQLGRGLAHPHVLAFAAYGWAFSFLVLLTSIVANWHRDSWHDASLPAWALPSIIVVPLAVAYGVFRLLSKSRRPLTTTGRHTLH